MGLLEKIVGLLPFTSLWKRFDSCMGIRIILSVHITTLCGGGKREAGNKTQALQGRRGVAREVRGRIPSMQWNFCYSGVTVSLSDKARKHEPSFLKHITVLHVKDTSLRPRTRAGS